MDEKTLSETTTQTIVDQPFGGKKNIIMDSQILSTLMACPRLADFRFNHNLQSIGGKSNSLECGSIVHTFLENYYRAQIHGINKNQALGFGMAAAELYIQGCPHCTNYTGLERPSCNHKVDEFPGVFNTPRESEGYLIGWEWVLKTCEQYVEFYKNDHWLPLEVEIVKGEVLYEDDEIRVLWKAKLDWIVDTNQGIYPVDHKTMKQQRNTISMNNQFIGQCLIMKTRNVFINKIGFQKTLKPEEKFQRVTIPYTAERLMEWQSETLPYYAKLLLMYAEGGHYPPNFTNCEGRYGKCAFLGVCESNPSMREEVIKNNFIVGPEWNPKNEDD